MARISFVGAGRLAFHLAPALQKAGHELVQVYSRTAASANRVAQTVEAQAISKWSQLDPSVDWIILAVADDAIELVARELAQEYPHLSSVVVHTSGGTPAALLGSYFARFGSFYPLQTFTYDYPVEFASVPICIYANVREDLDFLDGVARQISQRVYHLNDQQRGTLHVAAVFVNNFVNALYRMGYRLMEEDQIPVELLHPLMQATLDKVLADHPETTQTGPAARGDQQTIARHLERLAPDVELTEVYQLLTEYILRR